ncbi:MAG: glycoside hydrolase family 2 TIM barrel-domain containing protein, partial [Saprospiraceae bacterium]
MMKIFPILALLLSFSVGAWSQPVRQKINFDDNWKFHLGHAADAVKDFNYSISNIFAKTSKFDGTAIDPKFDDSAWQTVQLPHDWAVTLPFENSPNADVMGHGYKPIGGLYPQNSIGWYRKSFTPSRADSSNRFMLRFDGVFRDSKVWINGFYLGNQHSGYVSFAYDVSDYLYFNQPNTIVVRVDASQYEGWFYEGAGIYRHVWLEQYNNLHLRDGGIFVSTTLGNNQDAVVNIQTELENQNLGAVAGTVYSYLTDREGHYLARSSEEVVKVPAYGLNTIHQSITMVKVRPWSLQDPYLYRVVTVVKQGQTVVDSVITRLGVRKIEISSSQGLMLNGQPIKIKGVNCHQDHAGVGSALPDYLQYYRIRLLKEMGVNAYRTSHNPPSPELLDACDSLGMLVLDENRLLNSSPEYLADLEQLIRRDRNHASVFLWSIGNEEFYVQSISTGQRIAQALVQKQQQLDPTRTCTYACDRPNEFNGINEVIPVRGFNYRVKFMEPYHDNHPTQPVLGTEMGSTVTTRGVYVKDSIIGYLPDQDITYPWWANTAEQWWPLVANKPWNMGGFVWTGFDYRGEPTPFQWPNINSHFGILDMCGLISCV